MTQRTPLHHLLLKKPTDPPVSLGSFPPASPTMSTMLNAKWIPPSAPASTSPLPASPLLDSQTLNASSAANPRPSAPIPPAFQSSSPSLLASLISLKGQITHELQTNLPRLLALNPSRREAVADYLSRIAGQQSGPSLSADQTDAAGGLRKWLEGPRHPQQHEALQTYFDEIALLTIGQALLFKAWSDRGIRKWSQADLGKLNWALSSALRPHVPLDREGWQITKPNLFSWYNPSPTIQAQLGSTLAEFPQFDEDPSLLLQLAQLTQPSQEGYDNRFYEAVWRSMSKFGLDPWTERAVPTRAPRTFFSPTLRDGRLQRLGPRGAQWMGMEASPFLLMVAELVQLWEGPTAPPLWGVGSGLEVHTRDQLQFALNSPKPSLVSRIAEMEACDAAFVIEEQCLRIQGRSSEATRARAQLEELPFFKKLRAPGSSLGNLQAVVALSKLRPGGLLWWARDEALRSSEGIEILQTYLEKSRILVEFDFSELTHSLPVQTPLFPKFLYVLEREPKVENRLSHRPLRVVVQGQLRSHIELPSLLSAAFSESAAALESAQAPEMLVRDHFRICVQRSPIPQKEWAEHWPDPAQLGLIETLEKLRNVSLPLAHVTTIRPTPEGDPQFDHQWKVHPSLKTGFWLRAELVGADRKLVTGPLPRFGSEARGSGFLVLVNNEAWITPLRQYLESQSVANWLDHHAERRGGRWVLSDQIVRWIPVPKTLLACLRTGNVADTPPPKLSAAWETIASQLSENPAQVKLALSQLSAKDPARLPIHSEIFVRASIELGKALDHHSHVLSLVDSQGSILWKNLLNLLPKGECVSVPFHSRVTLAGHLPPHLAIQKIERLTVPSPALLLATEAGHVLQIRSDAPLLIEILRSQLEDVTAPTWNELLQYLRIPRRVEIAQSMANDVLKSYGQQRRILQELESLLAACCFI